MIGNYKVDFEKLDKLVEQKCVVMCEKYLVVVYDYYVCWVVVEVICVYVDVWVMWLDLNWILVLMFLKVYWDVFQEVVVEVFYDLVEVKGYWMLVKYGKCVLMVDSLVVIVLCCEVYLLSVFMIVWLDGVMLVFGVVEDLQVDGFVFVVVFKEMCLKVVEIVKVVVIVFECYGMVKFDGVKWLV